MPVFREQDNLRLFYSTLQNLMEEYTKNYEWEIIFVNDGSTDRTEEILEELSKENPYCRVIELSRFILKIFFALYIFYSKIYKRALTVNTDN